MAEVLPVFVLPSEHRPGQVNSTDGIPVIDLKGWHWEAAESPQDRSYRESIVRQIGDAAQEWGFFQIVNHGVSQRVLDEVESSAREFFDLDLEEKRKVTRTADNAMGYFDMELTKNVRDWKEVYDYLACERAEIDPKQVFTNKWPSNPPEFRDACKNYSAAMEALAFKVLELVVESLGAPAKALNEHFVGGSTRVRLNFYRKCPSPDLVLGVSRHKDGCALTLLAQDEVGGLQVKSKRNDQWVQVKARRDAFAVNIGDLIQVWSNGKYQSIEHRVVVNSTRDRFSCPVFFSPTYATNAAPLPDLVNENHPAKYKPVNWAEYYKMRRDGNFKNLGKPNVQIDNWAIDH
ncbi:2-oxoacid-dependent dioxygenase [Selaginella moellendorffii]|uniref:2-oxoacid-dependent dioxygenase n=1 Tax=Selaginella moellendorffii TaxID=88036 RepID=D8R864_SELML|nr:probable 2-oxoglutarate-dependent dioxygenase ANS [Selaginella moellendorffii]EFJ32004.1 2-oxoacid-dependent dioxygenase [Selaginella moellendorffii]|eukprot:XP_002967405.1 probable 2-oxoglutarate-dependent dioxygenase ANS [Selaginella moellendorffii]